MKYLFASALLVCCLCISQLIAQPVLNLSGIPPFGTVLTSSEVDGTGINPGAAGANQTWNFTAFPDTGAPVTFTYVDPLTTPFAADFPGSNYAFESEVIDGSTNYGFYNLNATTFAIQGNATLGSDGSEQIISYSDPETVIAFPCSYTSSSNDIYSLTFQNDVFTVNSNGTSIYNVDGYGTLNTSSGTYSNVLRFKRRRSSTESAVTPFGTFDSETQSTTYEFLRVASGASLVVWSISNDTTQSALTGNTITQRVNHTIGSFLTRVNYPVQPNVLASFPNPANNQVLIMLPQDATVSLLDLSGRLIKNEHFSISDGSLPIMELNDVPAGTYLVKAEGHHYVATSKILVMH